MKIHEYQGKAILKEYGVPVPRGIVARTPEEAEAAAKELGTDIVVVKAQIHAGGRGKGGGVKLAKSPAEAKEIASQMLGMHLVTHQTGPEGREVKTLLVEEGLPIDREFYLGITLDRVTSRNVFMASSAGGMEIEKVAEETPELIMKETVDPAVGLRPFQARKLAFGLGIPNELINQAAKFMLSLYDAYEKTDASLVEINPFLLTKDGRLIALDAKLNFD
ncbi:MAG TPA: ATP-grasp domain-containing protein, partial [Pyrinomonadaceae bacterium]